jgi:3-methyladenine DNA glycosylase AlkD
MTPEELVFAFEARLRPLASSERAAPMRAYVLNQFDFLGLPAPVRRAAARDLISYSPPDPDALLLTAARLWQLPEREFRYTAIDFLRKHYRLLESAHLPAIQKLLLQDAWWETVDGLVGVVGAIIRKELKTKAGVQVVMDNWIAHPDFWVRRAAMLHQLGWRLDTDEQRISGYSKLLANEKEFFIRKAIGWALRDYARWNPIFVRSFVDENRSILSGLTVREASRKL